MNKGAVTGFLICFAIASFLFSCENKTVDYGLDKYYVEIVTALNSKEFQLDNGKIIIATSEEKTKAYVLGDRVLMNYTMLTEKEMEDNYSVRINGSAKIPLGKLTLTSDSAINASMKEPVLLESVWLGSQYLNMKFYINYKSASHSIGLLTDSMRLESDTLRMYFVHNTNNDPPGYPSNAYLSFNLKDVLGEPKNGRVISMQINTSNLGDKIFDFKY